MTTPGNHLIALLPQRERHRLLAASAAGTRFHDLRPRLGRWLLISQDRARSDSFRLIHEFLGYMLGMRRVGINRAANELRGLGLIRYHCDEITVLDRGCLEAAACRCYGAARCLLAGARLIHVPAGGHAGDPGPLARAARTQPPRCQEPRQGSATRPIWPAFVEPTLLGGPRRANRGRASRPGAASATRASRHSMW
jgi:hypothetical protein